MSKAPHIEARGLHLAYGSYKVMDDISFSIERGTIFIIMGGSGSGKSTLLKNMIGLVEPAAGEVLYSGKSFTKAGGKVRAALLRRVGVLFQGGALWSSMTLGENVALPLEMHTAHSAREIAELVSVKLALVGLRGFEDFYPAQLSGGMKKRAALARAIALDPEILFFDEPSAGLDPVTSKRLDDLILRLRDSLGCTVVVVTHELPSLFAIGDTALFLDAEHKRPTALGNPQELLDNPPNDNVRAFLTRSGAMPEGPRAN